MSKRKRSKPRRKRRGTSHIGAPPGQLQIDPDAVQPDINAIVYDADGCEELVITKLSDIEPLLGTGKVVWINVDGVGDVPTLRAMGELFSIHPLTLEDIVHTHQRPKVERYNKYIYLVLRMLGGPFLGGEQISILVGDGFVLTFQERPGDCLDGLRARIRSGAGRVRTKGADYLAYALVDAIIDQYFPVLESHADRLDELEARVIARIDGEVLEAIYEVKKELRAFRRMVWPLRDMLSALLREAEDRLTGDTRVYFRDCIDHAVQLLDGVEASRDAASALMDLHMSNVSNRMNEVMKVLTIIATIFIPLSFIAGLYGMNFDTKSKLNMPELGWRYGYLFSLVVMAGVAICLLLFFWRKGWLGESSIRRRSGD